MRTVVAVVAALALCFVHGCKGSSGGDGGKEKGKAAPASEQEPPASTTGESGTPTEGAPTEPSSTTGDDGDRLPTLEKTEPLSEEEIAALRAGEATFGLILPSPGEILRAIDNFTKDSPNKPAWAGYVTVSEGERLPDRAAVAMAAGRDVTAFFLLVHAKDSSKAKPLADNLVTYAEKLGVADAVSAHGEALTAAVEAGKWAEVLDKMDSIYSGIRTKLIEGQADEATALLVAVGAWSEALHVGAGYVKDNYTAETAGLLAQKFIAEYFREEVGKLLTSPRFKDSAAVQRSVKNLAALTTLMHVGRGKALPVESVTALWEATGRIRTAAAGGATEGGNQ